MPRLVKNPGYTKPTKEEMYEAIKKVEEEKKDYLMNGEDKAKDHKKKVDKMNAEITSAFTEYLDNLKELLHFMDDFNMDHLECYTINTRAKSVHYSFADYDIFGKDKEENGRVLLDKFKDFLIMNGIPESRIKDPNEKFIDLQQAMINNKSDRNIAMNLYAVYYRAKRLQESYTKLTDNRYYIPEFIISLPVEKMSDYFFMHLVNQNLCDGIFDSTQVDPKIHERLHWRYYPVMFIDPDHAKKTRETIQASLKFLNEHNEYLF